MGSWGPKGGLQGCRFGPESTPYRFHLWRMVSEHVYGTYACQPWVTVPCLKKTNKNYHMSNGLNLLHRS